ncbi:MAG: Uma2 family endonuclease [Gemmatimonadales bacterium]|nr:Uma2 family endonuclease [Gemmatimonadales bacterium]
MASPLYYTADMVRALPDDGNRYEVVYGELLVTPAPRLWHQELAFRLARAIASYLEAEPVGRVLQSPADISWGPDVLVQPDVFVAPAREVATLDWARVKTLLLVAEVLSPSTARADRILKRRRYQEAGVPCLWLVDGDERVVEVWAPEDRFPRFERERLVWHPAGAGQAFALPLDVLFRAIDPGP